jgi:uncharacterized protein
MNPRLVIDLGLLPEEGKQFTGELPPEIFSMPEGDVRPVGPLSYDLHVQRFEGELLLSGSLSAPFEFTCVRTLHPFVQTIRIDHVPIAVEISEKWQIDVTEALREELLLEFPANPLCDDADEPMHCRIDPRYLAVDKPPVEGVESPPTPAGDDRWAALDAWPASSEDKE